MPEDQNIEKSQEDSKFESPKDEMNETISQEQIIEPIQPQTANYQLQTKEMEVHHHPNLRHSKKRWKEYVLEFLMIFLAVTLGFFSESCREYLNDRVMEKEYVESFIKDLKTDTLVLSGDLNFNNLKLKKIDSLYNMLQLPVNRINNFDLQRLIFATTVNFDFVASAGTITSLKSTGFLRLYNGTNIPQFINYYEAKINLTKNVETTADECEKKYVEDFMSKHFTPANMYKTTDPLMIKNAAPQFLPISNQLRNITQEQLEQFSVDLLLYKTYAEYVSKYYLDDIRIATDFIKELQKRS